MKKIMGYILIILLLVFSFYYTNKTIIILKDTDPIMKEIKKTREKYKISPINAKIVGNNIISGKFGKEIDYEKSYSKMKKYGTYNESLTTLKKIKPTISIEKNYDKYIVKGNSNNRRVALIFKLNNNHNKLITDIIKILKQNNIIATFFIDGTYLEKNISSIKKLSKHELEILSYNNTYDESFFKTTISYLESITKNKIKYCYTEQQNKELLNLCKKLKLHTIIPTLVLKDNIYKEVKNNLNNSIIISLEINNYVIKELPVTINYLKSKGYDIVSLDILLDEKG